jgi:3-oxoacyl-[acyl-carrier-protein] synthase-3
LLKKFISYSFGKKIVNVEEKLLENFDLDNAKKIINITGPKILKICQDNENTLTNSINAYKKFKIKNKLKNVSNLIYVTETPIKKFPGNSTEFASKISINPNISTFDLNAGCTGFVDAVKVSNGLKGNSLIVCSESYSKNINGFTKNLSTIFSDAASLFLYDKKKLSLIDYCSGFLPNSSNSLFLRNESCINMKGVEVYNFVTSVVSKKIDKILDKHKDIKLIFLHQASKIVCEYFENKLKKYKNLSVPTNILKRGNTVSSTIPILISDYLKKKTIKKNSKFLICGFGVGLSYSLAVLKSK